LAELDEFGSRRLRELKFICGDGLVERQLRDVNVELVLVGGPREQNVLWIIHAADRLPVACANIGNQFASRAVDLNSRHLQSGAVKPYFTVQFPALFAA